MRGGAQVLPASLAAAPALVGKPAEATRRRAGQPASRVAEKGAKRRETAGRGEGAEVRRAAGRLEARF